MLVIAHRGASFDFPENTIPAFERAIDVGADYVEFDVHNDLAVTHERPKRGVTYPTLDEVLEVCRGRIGVMVELKRPRRDTVKRTLERLDDEAVLVCFQRPPLEEARRLRPGLRTVQHVGFGVSIRRAAADGTWAVGFQNERVTKRGILAAQKLGVETTVYTVNDEARMLELQRLGVSGIFTDRPDLALRALERHSPAT